MEGPGRPSGTSVHCFKAMQSDVERAFVVSDLFNTLHIDVDDVSGGFTRNKSPRCVPLITTRVLAA